jgi:hypothetical protein
MAHIKIEDLPVGDNLTREEEELLLGAGLGTFRPTLESLETRQMMDAGLGSNLQLPIGPPMGGTPQHSLVSQLATTIQETAQQVRQLAAFGLQTIQATQAAVQDHIDQAFAVLGRQGPPPDLPHGPPRGLLQGQQEAPSVQGDVKHVREEARKFLNDKIIEGGKNCWGLKADQIDYKNEKVDGNRITIGFYVHFDHWGSPQEAKVDFIFQGKNTGGVKQYELVGAGLHDWKNMFGAGDTMFEGVAKEMFRNKVGSIECQRFDENTFVNNVIRQSEVMYGSKLGEHTECMRERIDGGFKVLIYTDHKPFMPILSGAPRGAVGRGELWLTFKYDDAQLAKGFVNVSDIRQGFWWKLDTTKTGWTPYQDKWSDVGDPNVHARMREVGWRLTDSGQAPVAVLERAGQQLGASALNWFKEIGSKGWWNDYSLGSVTGHVDRVDACEGGLRVTLRLERSVGANSIPAGISLTFTLKYEGQVNGQHQFKLADFNHSTPDHHFDIGGLRGFGINADEVRARFAQIRV